MTDDEKESQKGKDSEYALDNLLNVTGYLSDSIDMPDNIVEDG